MTILERVYASRPVDEVLISTLEIQISGQEPLRYCADFVDHEFGVDGVMQTFQGISLSVSLPAVNTSGQQTVTFAVPAFDGQAQRYVDMALESGERVPIIYREYLMSDPSQPARRPYVMTLVGGSFEDGMAQFQAAYYDLLNAAWPRERYTAETAPGIKYL